MAILPKLNSLPKYEILVPSIGKTMKFRPFLVKEEKVLLLAMESKDQKQILNAIVDTVIACVEEKLDKSKLTTYDVEYMFVKIRSKSVGEKSHNSVKCQSCAHVNEFTVNLDDVKINLPGKSTTKIELTEDFSLTLRHPAYDSLSRFIDNKTTQTQMTFNIIASCIESFQTKEENILAKEVPFEEILELLESMTPDQYGKIREFVEGIPKLEHKVTFVCEKCFEENTVKLSGMEDFLS